MIYVYIHIAEQKPVNKFIVSSFQPFFVGYAAALEGCSAKVNLNRIRPEVLQPLRDLYGSPGDTDVEV